MNFLISTIVLAIFILTVRTILYGYYWYKANEYFNKYNEYIKIKKLNTSKDADWFISDNSSNIKALLLRAGLKDGIVASVEPVGYGHVQTANISVFDNLHVKRADILNLVYRKLREARSIYRTGFWQTFSPLFWLDYIIFFPQTLFKYLHIEMNLLVSRIIQIIWYVVVFISTVNGVFFNPDFIEWIKKCFNL